MTMTARTMEKPSHARGAGSTKAAGGEKTPLQLALERPAPAGINEAAEAVQQAQNAMSAALSARDNLRSFDSQARLRADVQVADRLLGKALIQRDVAETVGGPAPSDEEIAALREAYDAAVVKEASVPAKVQAFGEAIDERREAVSEAYFELEDLLYEWRQPVLKALDARLAEVADELGDLLSMLRALRPAVEFRDAPTGLPSADKPGWHDIPNRYGLLPEWLELPMRAHAAGQRVITRV